MADGANLNASCLSSRAKKVNNNNSSISTAANMRRKTRQSNRRDIHNRVVLEKVLGITVSSSSALTCEPNTGLVAYPAGCVIVILSPKKNKQTHIFNTSRKTFSALAFSQNGKYLVTGESGHMPCVRVWDVAERTQVAEVQCHKYGVACVSFSPNGSYIVSVGYQHDRTVSVWEWKKGTVIASNKVSSRVLAVSFSEDNSYFVTAGNRHVKFWYLDASKERRVNSTVPLIGRSGLLGEHQNSQFCGLACGRGSMSSSTYCITHTGLLCQFNSNRQLDSWVDLKTTSAQCLSVSETFVFCGCADGTVRVFSPQDLRYISTLYRPHCLGVDVSQGTQPGHLFGANPEAQYPDTLALTFDPVTRHLTCVYNDHSVYVWDVQDIRNVGKVYSALYHSGCVWSVETYPELEDSSAACFSPSSFLTCSSDNTIRLWKSEFLQSHGSGQGLHHNLYSEDIVRIVYVDDDTQYLKAEAERAEGASQDGKSGIRVLGISPDGQHLAAGDRSGNLRIFGLQFMDELQKIEAHDSEVLCLAFSPTETGLHLLASASRDRLIHIFDMEKKCNLVQTVYDHSASITAIKFTGLSSELCMVSCGADKSIYFRSAEKTSEGLNFSRSHHIVEKSTLYDMDLDATRTHTAIACQDRNIRVYNVQSGKMKKCFKGSLNDDGTLLKVQLDPSGMFLATSCSDKNICIFDYESGECVATLFGHSEIVTGMKFSQDCRHLITVSGDSCVFVWRLDSQMTNSMRKRLAERKQQAGLRVQRAPSQQQQAIRRETYIAVPCSALPHMEEEEEGSLMPEEVPDDGVEDCRTPDRLDSTDASVDSVVLQTNGKMPIWVRRLGGGGENDGSGIASRSQYQPQGRWAVQSDPLAIRTVLEMKSMQLPLSHTPSRAVGEEEFEEDSRFHPQSLDSLLDEDVDDDDLEEEKICRDSQDGFSSSLQGPDFLQLPHGEENFHPELSSPEKTGYILYPANSTALSTGEGEFDVKALCEGAGDDPEEEELSPDSACSASPASHSDQPHDQDTDTLSQVSSTGSSGVEEDEEESGTLLHQHLDTLGVAANEKFNMDLSSLQPTTESNFLNPRLSISTRFLSRFQSRFRTVGTSSSAVCRPAACLPSIPDESSDSCPTFDGTMDKSKVLSNNSGSIEESEKSVTKKRSSVAARKSCQNLSFLCWKNALGEITNKSILSKAHNTVNTTGVLTTKSTSSAFDTSVTRSRQSYMGPTASSLAKITQSNSVETCTSEETQLNAPSSSLDLTVDQSKENIVPPSSSVLASGSSHPTPALSTPALGNHSARAALRLDLIGPNRASLSPVALKSRLGKVERPESPRRQALVTPTEMRSLGKECRKQIINIEQSLVSKTSSRFSTGSEMFARNSTVSETSHSVIEDLRFTESCGNTQATDQISMTNSVTTDREDPTQNDCAGDNTDSLTVQMCKEMVNELWQTIHKATGFYNKLCSIPELSEQQEQMKSILQEVFVGVQSELNSLCPQETRPSIESTRPVPEESPGRQLRDERTVALLDKYSEMLLLRMTEKGAQATLE
ncbi:mitogen-activated protein kinase-binding protein 1-like isoform X2 [Sinocyclocheilus anshuiensis]|uniref:mitogen-activated protein kinase-binding protein 1-like isoform X2 n=1 Tax=Sinocyclocheilus anshuiensis TaxID=1608454 RepID=UPI0007B7CEEF|nr:PREDICTED: mitogen-activated protein kinase-binding protein 1-like isoform X2 [Sinocyclocheilus anshuiensis]